MGVIGSLSWWQRLPEIIFPADTESRRACTEKDISKTVNCTTVMSGCIFMIVQIKSLLLSHQVPW